MNPKLIVVAGPNGAGKTTITEKLLRHEWMEDCVYINPDIIAQEEFGGWNSPEAIIKAANHAQKMREDCLSNLQSMAFETVFSIPEKLLFIQRAQKAGFFVRFFFICTNDLVGPLARIIYFGTFHGTPLFIFARIRPFISSAVIDV